MIHSKVQLIFNNNLKYNQLHFVCLFVSPIDVSHFPFEHCWLVLVPLFSGPSDVPKPPASTCGCLLCPTSLQFRVHVTFSYHIEVLLHIYQKSLYLLN